MLHWPSSLKVVKAWESFLKSALKEKYLGADFFPSVVKQIQEQTGTKGKLLFMPIRCAVLGQPSGAELKQVIPLIPKEVLLNRAALLLQSHSSS